MDGLDKPTLRRTLIANRQNANVAELQGASKKITKQLRGIVDWQGIQTLHSYLSVSEKFEVDTREFLQMLQNEYSNATVYVPVVQTGHIESAFYDSNVKLHKTEFGVYEPVDAKLVDAQKKFDVIIVPTLGFNEQGYRLGYGGGFYDKFLSDQENSIKVGICYQAGKREFKPESHDIAMDIIVTESHVFKY